MANVVVLQGRLSRPVSERALPSGDRLASLELTVPASRSDREGGKAESVPLAWFGPPGWALDLDAGAELVVVGRVRRRFFRGGAGVQSRTEVVVEGAAPARHAGRASALVERAVEALRDISQGEGRSRRRAPPTFP